MKRYFITPLLLLVFSAAPARAQFDQAAMKQLLSEFSLQLFGENAQGFMGPLVIVSNVGANHGFFNSAHLPKENKLHFQFSVQTVYAWVRDDQRSYVGTIPYQVRPGDGLTLQLFKQLCMQPAVAAGDMPATLQTATVFGGVGSLLPIPKKYLKTYLELAKQDTSVLQYLPDVFPLTSGTNQKNVFGMVPQLNIGTFFSTDMLLRYIPPIEFDTAVGAFSFFGVAVRHGFTNWIRRMPFDAAVQVSYQHSSIENEVGLTRAKLAAGTDMFSVNLHASKRFNWFEPYVGVSFEYLHSSGTYTFTLPANIVDQIGYDIDPQTAHISLYDRAYKLTLGTLYHIGIVDAFVSAGISKHFILGGGAAINFDAPWERSR
jgi:hypothetical protein